MNSVKQLITLSTHLAKCTLNKEMKLHRNIVSITKSVYLLIILELFVFPLYIVNYIHLFLSICTFTYKLY